MRAFLAIIATMAIVVGGLSAQEAPDEAAVLEEADTPPTLEELRWVARPLVVFADSSVDPRFRQQIAELNSRAAELEERRVVVLSDTRPAERGPLRQELRPRGFGLVLIDTDGTVVQRRPSVTTAREILNLIDRLPSRRQETGSRRP